MNNIAKSLGHVKFSELESPENFESSVYLIFPFTIAGYSSDSEQLVHH